MRTIVYIDGFNLYYGSLKNSPNKWLDLWAYFQRTLPANCSLVKIKYFTARVSPLPNDPDAPARQDAYIRALRTNSQNKIQVIEGHFSTKKVRMALSTPPHNTVEVIKCEEKGSDVNLAVELVNDSWLGAFDCAVVVSNDADLSKSMEIVKRRKTAKVFLYTPGGPIRKPLCTLVKWSHKQFNVLPVDLVASQLPSPIPGTAITKPATW
ncbi:MAG TPA: NYN domain-containing protein [Azonexus sp.]|nr:NYN domain-containing protein [Azonexus sp.]